MNERLAAAAMRVAEGLPEHDETGCCPTCRRRRDPNGPRQSHAKACALRDFREVQRAMLNVTEERRL